MEDAKKKYADIIDLPHHVSERHVPMPRLHRAAQFSPFAALTGYEALIAEAGRATEPAPTLDDAAIEELNRKLMLLQRQLPARPTAEVTVFYPDPRKAGGAYRTHTGVVTAVDPQAQTLTLEGQPPIPLEMITDLRF